MAPAFKHFKRHCRFHVNTEHTEFLSYVYHCHHEYIVSKKTQDTSLVSLAETNTYAYENICNILYKQNSIILLYERRQRNTRMYD